MQNHMVQVLCIVAMEPPITLHGDYVRDEKVRVLKHVPKILLKNVTVGQYVQSPDGKVKVNNFPI